MKQEQAEKMITEYLKPIYGFALKRCANLQDAEDLSHEVALRALHTLLTRDDIESPDQFIWTIAHNALSNYYRNKSNTVNRVLKDELLELYTSDQDVVSDMIRKETISRLRSEIAYLSKVQRKVVIAYFFENKKQGDIASELGIPLGTVKWHLFEAKKDLKKGMNIMRQTSDLKFNPIKFHSLGINGSSGTTNSFFRSALSQNIAWCVRQTAKTIAEISDDLGVSPVYVENEIDYLEEYCFLEKKRDKYIINFLLDEPTAELLTMQNEMYKKAAHIFANELYDELISSGLIDDSDIVCGQTDAPVTLTESKRADRNFLLWSLVPYIAATSGEKLIDNRISFDEVATIRSDGGHNIFHASVVPDDMVLPADYIYMKNWNGPCWNATENHTLWQIDTEWSEKRVTVGKIYSIEAGRVLSLYERELDDVLPQDEYAWLAQRGFVKTNGAYKGHFKSSWQIVTFANIEIRDKLLAVGDRIKEKYKDEFEGIKAPYNKATLANLPEHLKKIRAYELQFTFHSDGWFLCHCINTLLHNGKLKEPTENQRKSLTTLIIPNK